MRSSSVSERACGTVRSSMPVPEAMATAEGVRPVNFKLETNDAERSEGASDPRRCAKYFASIWVAVNSDEQSSELNVHVANSFLQRTQRNHRGLQGCVVHDDRPGKEM